MPTLGAAGWVCLSISASSSDHQASSTASACLVYAARSTGPGAASASRSCGAWGASARASHFARVALVSTLIGPKWICAKFSVYRKAHSAESSLTVDIRTLAECNGYYYI